MKKWTGTRCVVIAVLLMTQMVRAKTIYVDASATGSNNGTSWTNAYVYLQDALAAAVANDEIRVAAGTYQPDRGKSVTLGDRNVSFVLKNLVKIMGGYPAGGGSTRDWEANKTFLSGDLNGDDAPDTLVQNLLTDATRADNSYHVIYSTLCGSPTLLDGLIITGGQANGADTLGYGGGWYNITNGSPTFTNCLFTRNAAASRGGAWYNSGANCKPTLTNVTFMTNFCADRGGAIALLNAGADMKLDNCTLTQNYATNYAGGLYLDKSSPTVFNTNFSDDYAVYGGSLAGLDNSSPTITNASFSNSSATQGGAVWLDTCQVKFYNCTFSTNSSTDYAGACFLNYGKNYIENCTFNANRSAHSGAIYNHVSDTVMNLCKFLSNDATSNVGGAIYTFGSSPQMTRCLFHDNYSASQGGAIYNSASHPKLISCSFIGNYSASHGGAISNQAQGNGTQHAYLTGLNCLFSGNYVTGSGACGGAIANFYTYVGYWEGNRYTYVKFVNSTFYNNISVSVGGALYTNHGSSTNTLQNCILYGNADTGGGSYSESAQIYGGTNTIQYSCIQGLSTYVGNGNIGSDPQFANPLGDDWIPGTPDDNLRLTKGSPCVDAGNNTLVPAELTTDLDGMPRFWDDPDTPDTGVAANPGDPIVDMGAYELNLQGPVAFCDANLKAAVEASLGLTDPTPNDMLNLTSLTATGKNIVCLEGLEYALNLTSLNLTSNKIVDISPLKNLPLQNLYLGGNQLGGGDWQSTIATLTSLKSLYLHSNGLISIPGFCEQTNLQNLYLYSNKITDLCPLTDCLTTLLDLRVQSNPLQVVEWFETCVPQIKANNPKLVSFMYDPNCNLKQKADINKDCLVNLADFAIMADEWLTCDYIYQQLCP
ncbi:right-handed parallel beta-helix repeat-containing protein [Anaerohalosphaeraceae bacterium U12dextr]